MGRDGVGAGMWALGASMTHGVEASVNLHPGQAARAMGEVQSHKQG